MKMPGFNAEAALPFGGDHYRRIPSTDKNGGAQRVVLSSFWDSIIDCGVGYITGGPAGCAVAVTAGAAAREVFGEGGGMCVPVSECRKTVRIEPIPEIGFRGGWAGVEPVVCWPGGMSTRPCFVSD
jgi:hypothetical protein